MNVLDGDGLLVVDKPAGMTSRRVVDHAQRWWARRTRLGHAGTLDPLATGILVLCVGKATRLIEYIQDMDKVYRARVLLGFRSDSDDADGVITPTPGATAADKSTVAECVSAFVGTIEQVPPRYSAARIAGQRAYDLARRGEEVTLSPRRVEIYAIHILDYSYPYLDLEVCCGKGTYIRSLARALGERLGCGALVQSLRRTRLGPFTVEEALSLDADAEMVRTHLLPMEKAVAALPRLVLSESQRKRLEQGQVVVLAETPTFPHLGEEESGEAAVFDERGQLAAVARFDPRRGTLRPVKVFQSKKR